MAVGNNLKNFYNEDNDIWGKPQKYRGVDFYPIVISDTRTRELFYRYICLPKNHFTDINIIRMSYLKFILFFVALKTTIESGQEDDANFFRNVKLVLDEFREFLTLITHNKDVTIECGWNFDVEKIREQKIIIKIGSINFTESDFETIRELILVQNGMTLKSIEEYNPELEAKLVIKNRLKGEITFADNIFVFCSLLKKTPAEIENCTLYQLKHLLTRLNRIQEYELYKPLEVSGQISFKNGDTIKDYMHVEESTGRYDSIRINKEDFIKNNSMFKDETIKKQGS